MGALQNFVNLSVKYISSDVKLFQQTIAVNHILHVLITRESLICFWGCFFVVVGLVFFHLSLSPQ